MPTIPTSPSTTVTEAWANDAVDLAAALIRNGCVNTGDPDSGNEIRSVRTIQDYLGAPGVVVEPHPRRASVVYRIAGHDPSAPRLLMIPHLDVVPADAAAWSTDPFAGHIADGFLWGRGAVDMLNLTGAMVAVFGAIQRGALPPPAGDLVLACVADEEAGGALGAGHLVDEHWDLVACDAVLTEVAAPAITTESGSAIPVTVSEKGPAWQRLTATGIAGHGSQPHGRSNAVLTLASAFDAIGSEPQPIAITDEWRAFVPYLPVSESVRAMLVDPDQVDEAISILATDDAALARWVHACTHLTLSPNVMSGGTKSNVVPASATGEVDVRLLPGQDRSDILDHLRKILGPEAFEELAIEPVLDDPANTSPTEGPLWDAIAAATADHLPDADLAPTMTPVTTDARFFRARGIPAYGVGLFDDRITLPEMLAMFHGADERVGVASIRSTAAFLASVIGHLSEPSAPPA